MFQCVVQLFVYVCQYCFYYVWVIGNDVVCQYIVMIVGEVVDNCVSFMGDQFVCGEILWFQGDFKVIVNVVGGYIGQIQCGRVGVMEVGIFGKYVVENIYVGGGVLFCFEWEVGCDNGVVEVVSVVVVQMVVVQLCVLVVGCGKQFVMYWIVDYCDFSMIFDVYGDGNREVWQMFNEVGGVIQWIDNLLNILFFVSVFIVFFGDNGVLWVRFVNGFDNNCFGGFIDVGYKIIVVFLVGFYGVWCFVVFGN